MNHMRLMIIVSAALPACGHMLSSTTYLAEPMDSSPTRAWATSRHALRCEPRSSVIDLAVGSQRIALSGGEAGEVRRNLVGWYLAELTQFVRAHGDAHLRAEVSALVVSQTGVHVQLTATGTGVIFYRDGERIGGHGRRDTNGKLDRGELSLFDVEGHGTTVRMPNLGTISGLPVRFVPGTTRCVNTERTSGDDDAMREALRRLAHQTGR